MPSQNIVGAYLAAAVQTWASARVRDHWRWMWRLKRLGIHWQLKNAQEVGPEVELTGPVLINNAGTIKIGRQARFDAQWHKPIVINVLRPEAVLTIEHNAGVNFGTEISLVREVFIGAYSMVSIDCLIYDTDWHTLDGLDRDVPTAPTHIGRGVWLGARVVVLKGVTIGDNTVVAANSVVTQSLPEKVLAGGVPAKVIRPIERRKYIPGSNGTDAVNASDESIYR